jgi:hypothetical protein
MILPDARGAWLHYAAFAPAAARTGRRSKKDMSG